MSQNLTVKKLEEIKKLLNLGKIRLSKDAKVVFVCGASLDTNQGKNVRKSFLKYAEKYLVDYDVFIAEDFFDLFKEKKIDLLSIENDLGAYSDCIIIFLESESAIAELGAFANSDNLAEQILVINKSKYRKSTSFISQGPIAKVNRVSRYGTTIYADLNSVLKSVSEIKERLDSEKSKYNKGIKIDSHRPPA